VVLGVEMPQILWNLTPRILTGGVVVTVVVPIIATLTTVIFFGRLIRIMWTLLIIVT
jgi:hypothetical protein